MLPTSKSALITIVAAAVVGLGVFVFGCQGTTGVIGAQDAADRVYVAPGEYDEFYAFLSGGYSGQLSVWGLPSARLLKVIPVFSQDPESGYGYSEETKHLLETSYGFIPWDDSHHPLLSRTNGEADGRWIFINGNNTPRIARIDLTTFETKEILELPNTGGNHASAFVTSNTEYVVGATRFSIPLEQDMDVPIATYKENFDGAFTFVKVDPVTGEMSLAFQIRMPPYHFDLARAGMGISGDWVFFTSYNTEEAHTLLEIEASRNDKDFVAAVNWRMAEAAVSNGLARQMPGVYFHNSYDSGTGISRSEEKNGVLVLDPADVPGMIYFMPTPKSPHGVDIDPTGEYIVAGGKLATVIPVHSFSRMLAAIEARDFVDEINGIPVLRYESTIIGEVENPGLGPLHTEFDGRGYAYTSVYITSEIVKWSLETFQVVDRIDAYYSIGHLMITAGDTENPDARYLLGMSKTARDRFLPGGSQAEPPGAALRHLRRPDGASEGLPHHRGAPLRKLDPCRSADGSEPAHLLDCRQPAPHRTQRVADARVEREGNVVRVYMGASAVTSPRTTSRASMWATPSTST
jgi:nitrous-oxide reductase